MSAKFRRGAVVADSVKGLDIALSGEGDAFSAPRGRGNMGIKNEPKVGAPLLFKPLDYYRRVFVPSG